MQLIVVCTAQAQKLARAVGYYHIRRETEKRGPPELSLRFLHAHASVSDYLACEHQGHSLAKLTAGVHTCVQQCTVCTPPYQ